MSNDLKNARKVLSEYDKLVDELRAENANLRQALDKAQFALMYGDTTECAEAAKAISATNR